MRILLVIDKLRRGGGTETHVVSLGEQLVRRGHHVGIFTTGGAWTRRATSRGIQVHHHPLLPKHLNEIVRLHNYHVVHVHDNLGSGLVARTNIPSGVKVVTTIHGLYMDGQPFRNTVRKSAALIAVSPMLRTYAIQRCGFPQSKVILVPNSIDTQQFKPRNPSSARIRLQLPLHTRIIGYAGRFTSDKAIIGKRVIQELKRYAASHPNVLVVVAGRDSKKFVSNSTSCRVLGHIDDMSTFYNACDVVIGSGRVALEGLASGRPTIAIGPHAYVGPVMKSSWNKAIWSNFGDHAVTQLTWRDGRLNRDVHTMLHRSQAMISESAAVCRRIRMWYSHEKMVQKILDVYRT